MRRAAVCAAAMSLALLASSGRVARAHLGPHEVSIRNNFYQPEELSIDPGETVTWTAIDSGHTATADDGSFNVPEEGTLDAGQTAGWTAPHRDVTIVYGCRVHASMRGAIVVGEGSPAPPPPVAPIQVRDVPSAAYPTIAAALIALPPRARVQISPGTYPGPLIVRSAAISGVVPDVTVVGLGDEPGDVVITGDEVHNTGIAVLSGGVRLDNLTVTGFTSTGILVDDVRGFSIERVSVQANGSYGIRARASRAGRIAGSAVTGSAVAGIAIQDCANCDVLVDGVRVEDSLAGFSAFNAGAIVLRDSVFRRNGVGVVLKSFGALQQGSHILDNVIEPGDAPRFSGSFETLDLDARAGVWIAGGWFNVIERNVIGGDRWGVLITGFNLPVRANMVVDNVLTAAADAHLAWDGLGADTCFRGNALSEGAAPVTQPPSLERLYPCDRTTVGVPYPLVDVAVLTG